MEPKVHTSSSFFCNIRNDGPGLTLDPSADPEMTGRKQQSPERWGGAPRSVGGPTTGTLPLTSGLSPW